MTARVPSLSSLLLDRRSSRPESNAQGEPRDTLAALRAELEEATDPLERARLCQEVGGFEQARGQLAEAAQSFVEATNLDPAALAPLRALIGLALRRQSPKNLGPLLERLALVASTAEEKQQAYLLLAELQVRSDASEEALATVERWLDDFPDDPTAWLTLDVLASSRGGDALRERARMGRAALTPDGPWRALLLLECAELRARADDAETALALCRQAVDEDSDVSNWMAWERMAARLQRWSEASDVAEATAQRATEVIEAESSAVARPWHRSEALAPLYLLRAAEWARRAGDEARSRALLDQLHSRGTEELLPRLARLELARSSSDNARRRELAEDTLRVAPQGPIAAALWLELAAAAAHGGDAAAHERALRNALASDPDSPLPLARFLDQLEARGAGTDYAATLAGVAERMGPRRVDWLLSAALVSAVADPATAPGSERWKNVAQHLQRAREAGAEPAMAAQLAALLAQLLGDRGGFEGAAQELLALGGAPGREACFGWLRSRLVHGAEDSPESATLAAGQGDPLAAALTVWVPRAVGGTRGDAAAHAWRDALIADGAAPELVRAAELLTVRRLLEAGKNEAAAARLREALREDPADPTAAALLAALLAPTDSIGAAEVLASAARLQNDPTLRAGWLLRASRLLWQARRPREAAALAGEAELVAAGAARPWLTWGARLVAPDDPSAQTRLLLELEDDRGVHPVLEGLTLAAAGHGAGSRVVPALSADHAEEPSVRWLTALLDAAEAGSGLSPQALDALPGAPAGLGAALLQGALLQEAREKKSDAASAPGALAQGDVLDSASHWARAAQSGTDGVDGALAWLVASRASRNAFHEVEARLLLAERLAAPELEVSAALLARLTHAPRAAELGQRLRGLVTDRTQDAARTLSARWAALEFAPPGAPPLERAEALEGLATGHGELGPESKEDVNSTGTWLTLAGWNHLRAQRLSEASAAFRRATERLPDDLGAWEGLRSVAQQAGDARLEAEACAELARRTSDGATAAALWERAGVLHQDVLGETASAEEALRAALAQDLMRDTAFERLYLLARSRGDEERLLELVEARLAVVEDPRRLNELLWAKARHCRALRDEAAALRTLEQLLDREPGHLGALALMSDLCLRGRHHRRAAGFLARLADHPEAPVRQRVLSGLAAAELYEQRLGELGRALEVLEGLEREGLGTEPVLERLALASLRAERWATAARCLEQLLEEAASMDGRMTAASFLLALYRDQMSAPERAAQVAEQLLEWQPSHPDALALLLEGPEDEIRRTLLARALDELREEALGRGLDAVRMALAARLAQELGLQRTALAAHGMLHLQGATDTASWSALAQWANGCQRAPSAGALRWTEDDLQVIASPADEGPFLELAREVSRSCPGLEPTASELGLGDAGGSGFEEEPHRHSSGAEGQADEMERWALTLGLPGLVTKITSKADGVAALAGSPPTLVLPNTAGPEEPTARARAVAALYALRRGSAPWLARTEREAALLIAALGRAFELAELERVFGADADPLELDALVERLTVGVEPEARERLAAALERVPRDREAFRRWYWAGRRSLLRMGALALGDPSGLGPLLSECEDGLEPQQGPSEQLLAELGGFVLSTEFVRLRSAVELEGS
jgi:hypothetical protein